MRKTDNLQRAGDHEDNFTFSVFEQVGVSYWLHSTEEPRREGHFCEMRVLLRLDKTVDDENRNVEGKRAICACVMIDATSN